MTMKQIVSRLLAEGHQVEFYVRKDGGILIRKIDNEKFIGAKGNARARELVGANLSEARAKQLSYATRARKVSKANLDDEVVQEFKRVKKLWNKRFKSKQGKSHPAGYFGWRRIKYAYEHYGREEALRRISEAERYASGMAYSKNVIHLADYIRYANAHYNSESLEQLAKDIESNAYAIREEWIKPAYDEMYKLNAGISPSEIARNVRRILRLA